jgi:uncharacterized protein DUF4333
MLSKDGERRNELRGVAVALLACVLLVGCGGTSGGSAAGGNDVTDLSELEAKLVDLQEEKAPHLSVEGAECPEEVDLEQGTEFECIVTIEGVEAPYSITLTKDDPEADEGSFDIKPALAIIDVSIVVDFIQGRAGDSADVECGTEAVIVGDVGDTFDCTVDAGGQQQTVEMIIKDLDGTVSINN